MMTDLMKALKGTGYCGAGGICRKCPYHSDKIERQACIFMMSQDANIALRNAVDEIESLKNTIYNLRLYLTESIKIIGKEAFDELMMAEFDAMPGFVSVEEE